MDDNLGLKFKNVKIDFIFSFFINKEQSRANFHKKYTEKSEVEKAKYEDERINPNEFSFSCPKGSKQNELSLMNLLCYDLSEIEKDDNNKVISKKDIYTNKFKFSIRNDIQNHCNDSLEANINDTVKEDVSFYERNFCDNYTRRVILPNLRVKKHECFKKLDFGRYVIKSKEETADVEWNEIAKTNRLEGLVRIMDSGIGTLTLTFYINNNGKPITAKTIFDHYTLLNLSDNKQYEYPQLITEHDPFLLNANLKSAVNADNNQGNKNRSPNRLINKLSQLLTTLCNEKGIITFGCEKHQTHHCHDNYDCSVCDALLDHSSNLDCQNPYIVVTGKLEKKSIDLKYDKEKPFAGHPTSWWNYYDGKGLEKIKPNEQRVIIQNLRETMLLLLRYIIGGKLLELNDKEFDRVVPLPFYRPSLNVFMKNFSYFEHIYIASHHRTTILFHEDVSDEFNECPDGLGAIEHVPEFVSDSILDLFETIRMRWHFSVILNELLDGYIKSIEINPTESRYKSNLFIFRKQFSLFLSDPLTYSYGGTLVNDLIEQARDSFQLDYLTKLLETKFEVIDKLHSDYLRARMI